MNPGESGAPALPPNPANPAPPTAPVPPRAPDSPPGSSMMVEYVPPLPRAPPEELLRLERLLRPAQRVAPNRTPNGPRMLTAAQASPHESHMTRPLRMAGVSLVDEREAHSDAEDARRLRAVDAFLAEMNDEALAAQAPQDGEARPRARGSAPPGDGPADGGNGSSRR